MEEVLKELKSMREQQDQRHEELNAKIDSISAWKPDLEAKVAELQTAVHELQTLAQQSAAHRTDLLPASSSAPGGAVPVPLIGAAPSILGAARLGAFPGPTSHGVDMTPGGQAAGIHHNPPPPPANGNCLSWSAVRMLGLLHYSLRGWLQLLLQSILLLGIFHWCKQFMGCDTYNDRHKSRKIYVSSRH